MPDLGGGADGGLAPAARQPLLDRHRRRNAVHRVDLGPARRLHDAARIGVERFEVAPLAFVEQDVESQRRLARARHAGDHAELVVRDVDRQRLEVVLAGVDDLDGVGPAPRACPRSASRSARRRRRAPRACASPGPACCRTRAAPWPCASSACSFTSSGGPSATSRPPASPPSGPRSISQSAARITSRLCSITISELPPSSSLRNARISLAMSSKCRPVVGSSNMNSVPRVAVRLPAGRGALRGLRQEARELEALRFAARQRGHRLAELHVFQPDVDDGLQRADHVAVVGEQRRRFAHGEVQHVGDVHRAGIGI